jgi:hypothetical protein
MDLVGAKIHYVNANKLPWVLQGFFSQQNSHGPAVLVSGTTDGYEMVMLWPLTVENGEHVLKIYVDFARTTRT